MDVHPPKNGINRYWSIPIYVYIYTHICIWVVNLRFSFPRQTLETWPAREDRSCPCLNAPAGLLKIGEKNIPHPSSFMYTRHNVYIYNIEIYYTYLYIMYNICIYTIHTILYIIIHIVLFWWLYLIPITHFSTKYALKIPQTISSMLFRDVNKMVHRLWPISSIYISISKSQHIRGHFTGEAP